MECVLQSGAAFDELIKSVVEGVLRAGAVAKQVRCSP